LKMKGLVSGIDLIAKLPVQLGGLGFCPDPSSEDWEEVLEMCSPAHIRAIQWVAGGCRLPVVLQALSSIGTRSSARGVEARSDEEHLCFFMHSFAAMHMQNDFMGHFPPIKEVLVPNIVSEQEFAQLRYHDQVKILKENGFELLRTLVQEFNRPTLFSELLRGEREVRDWREVPFPVRLIRMEKGLASAFAAYDGKPGGPPDIDCVAAIRFLKKSGSSESMSKLINKDQVIEIGLIEHLLNEALKHFINNVDADLNRHNVPDSLRIWLKPYLERYAVHVRHPHRGDLLEESVDDEGFIRAAPPPDAEKIGPRPYLLPIIRANKPVLRLPMEPMRYRE